MIGTPFVKPATAVRLAGDAHGERGERGDGAREAARRVAQRREEVRDEQGRRRFHGAFTGGFSAGYFNSVGSAEGWTPSTWQSSRADKRGEAGEPASPLPSWRDLRTYMDAEDMDDAMRASFAASGRYADALGIVAATATVGAARAATLSEGAPLGVIPELLVTSGELGVGRAILRRWGWRDGSAIGSTASARWRDPHADADNAAFESLDALWRAAATFSHGTRGIGFGGPAETGSSTVHGALRSLVFGDAVASVAQSGRQLQDAVPPPSKRMRMDGWREGAHSGRVGLRPMGKPPVDSDDEDDALVYGGHNKRATAYLTDLPVDLEAVTEEEDSLTRGVAGRRADDRRRHAQHVGRGGGPLALMDAAPERHLRGSGAPAPASSPSPSYTAVGTLPGFTVQSNPLPAPAVASTPLVPPPGWRERHIPDAEEAAPALLALLVQVRAAASAASSTSGAGGLTAGSATTATEQSTSVTAPGRMVDARHLTARPTVTHPAPPPAVVPTSHAEKSTVRAAPARVAPSLSDRFVTVAHMTTEGQVVEGGAGAAAPVPSATADGRPRIPRTQRTEADFLPHKLLLRRWAVPDPFTPEQRRALEDTHAGGRARGGDAAAAGGGGGLVEFASSGTLMPAAMSDVASGTAREVEAEVDAATQLMLSMLTSRPPPSVFEAVFG